MTRLDWTRLDIGPSFSWERKVANHFLKDKRDMLKAYVEYQISPKST